MVDSQHKWKAWVYLAPALILLLVFTVWPIINTFHFAFLNDYSSLGSNGGETYQFGISNFTKVITYRGFLTCLKNTALLCVLTVPLSCFLALIIAVFLNSITKFSKLLQTIFFLPYVTNTIAIGMVFAMMFNIVGLRYQSDYGKYCQDIINAGGTPKELFLAQEVIRDGVTYQTGYTADSWGIINNFLTFLKFDPIIWINQGSSYSANIAVLVIYIVWNALPFKILILLGGLQSVNKQYYDAAKIDGASRLTIFGRITVPLLSPMIAYVVITGFIGGFKEYTSVVGIYGTSLGPTGEAGKLNTIVGYIYDALAKANYGVASAASLILFLIIFAVTLVNLYVSNKKVHY
ncbi:MAG: sugar ABC transporter permease [Erysipelotrichaceae bacterium]|nr:sugar ABC transporter permease [Erysipelotrichaceae bacterium]